MLPNRLLIALSAPMFCLSAATCFGAEADGKKGFDKHCAVCHPNGGNTINPQKPLSKKSMNSHGIKSAKDIVATMRKPGPGMTKFDEKTVPEKEAKAIADYILKTFK